MFLSADTRTRCLRIFCLIVGCMMVSGSGPVLSFNVYANSLKDTFNFTQSEVELCASMINLGHKMGFPMGVLQEVIGSRAIAGFAASISLISWLLLYLSTGELEFYSDKAWLLSIYFFLAGLAAIAAFMGAVPLNFSNFRKGQRGRVVSCLEGCYSLSPAIVALIYANQYVNGFFKDPDLQDLRGFFLLQVFSWAILFSLGVFLGSYPPQEVKDSEASSLVDSTCSEINGNYDSGDAPPRHISQETLKKVGMSKNGSIWGWPVLKDLDFQCFMWGFIIYSGAQTLFLNNLTTILASHQFFAFNQLFTVVAPITTFLALAVTGPFSDWCKDTVPRFLFVFCAHIIQLISFIILTIWGNELWVIFFAMLGVEISSGVLFCISPTYISETYGVYYFGRNWGGTLLGSAFIGFIYQAVLGYFYEERLEKSLSARYCFGSECFQNIFIIVIFCMALGIILDVILLRRHYKRYREYKQLALQASAAEINNAAPEVPSEETGIAAMSPSSSE